MSTPLPTGISSDLQFNQTTGLTPETSMCFAPEPCSNKGFKDVLADENLLSEVVEDLKNLLSEEEFARIEEMLQSGNGLPLAAIFPPDHELFAQVSAAILQSVGKFEDKLLGSAQSLSDSVAQHIKDASARAIESIGRQVGEALPAASDGAGGPGKQVQDFLLTLKTEFSTADLIPKALVPTAISVESAASSIPNINSAISGLAQLTNFQASSVSPLPSPITAPLGEQGWGEAMGERIMWMMGKGIQGASIRINPPHLGPIQVQLSVQNDQASINMLAQHGVVKEALEAALPRLREMLAESNLQLVNVDVSHRENMQHGERSELTHQDQDGYAGKFLTEPEEVTASEEDVTRSYVSSGLLDDYA